MLSGVSPFAADTVGDVIVAVLTRVPPPLANVPPKLTDIVTTALEKDRSRRYQTAKDLLQDLSEVKQQLDAPVFRGPGATAAAADPRLGYSRRDIHCGSAVRQHERGRGRRVLLRRSG